MDSPDPTHTPPTVNRETRITLAKALIRMFDEWELAPDDRLILRGLPTSQQSTLTQLAAGEPLPADLDSLERAHHLLHIYKLLKLLFPRNPDFRNGWMRAKNQMLEGQRPVDIAQRPARWPARPATGPAYSR